MIKPAGIPTLEELLEHLSLAVEYKDCLKIHYLMVASGQIDPKSLSDDEIRLAAQAMVVLLTHVKDQ